jgi:Uma2 family endonuclease
MFTVINFADRIPPLVNGDKLTRPVFEYRYQAMPSVRKAELIGGSVYMASPLHFESHAEPHALIITWLGVYYADTPGIHLGDNATIRLDLDNELQPDALLRLPEKAGGHSRLTPDDYLAGAPELIVEVAASSAAYDLHEKKTVYRRHGVQEYLVWQIYDQCLDWFILKDGDYVVLAPDASGLIQSQAFPGLVLHVKAMLNGHLGKVLTVLKNQGLQTKQHQAFVAQLSSC